jgi:AraC family transcriptional regulator of adaptative response/methylated-DNA-[protein]-cysteine methyltransferase
MCPATYKRGGAGASIEWAVGKAAIGLVLVAATEAGVCFVEIGQTKRALVSTLEAEFPQATLVDSASARMKKFVASACALASGQTTRADLPLDIIGTAFQWRVWRALKAIPAGATRTYGDISRALNLPRAARAVGRACGSNPVALVIPCHRVVQAGGDLGGYRWGVAIKKELLALERARLSESGNGESGNVQSAGAR